MKKVFLGLILGSLFVAQVGMACDLNVDSQARIETFKKKVDNRTNELSKMLQSRDSQCGWLDLKFYFADQRQRLPLLAASACNGIKNELEKSSGFLAETYSCEYKEVENPARYKVADSSYCRNNFPGSFGNDGEYHGKYNAKVYTYALSYSYKQFVPALSEKEIKYVQLQRVNACMKTERNSDKLMKLYEKRIQLQAELRD